MDIIKNFFKITCNVLPLIFSAAGCIYILCGGEPFDYDEMVAQFKVLREKMLPMICDSVSLVNEALENDKVVLFEGAQANMLDINYGTYPFVTSSSPTSAGVLEGAGVPPQSLTRIIGIAKAYSTRVGEGPFVTEQLNEIGDQIRIKGHEFGTVTGRSRRCRRYRCRCICRYGHRSR